MSNNGNIKINTILNAIKSIFSILYPMITFPYVSRVLMAENLGKVNFASSVVSYISLIASLGVSTYAVRECSRVRSDKKELQKTASQILSINICSTIIAYITLILLLIVAKPLSNYRELICIQSTSILFATLGADWLNTVMEDFFFITVRTIGMQLFSLCLLFVFVRKPEDYVAYAILSVVASSGANIMNIFYRRKFCKIRFTLKMDLRKHLPPIILLFSLILAQTIYCNADMTMLGLMKGDYEVGLYSTSVKIYNIVNTMMASVAMVVMPQLSESYANRNFKEINRLLKYALNFIVVLGIPCLVGINVISEQLICTIAGEEYAGAALSLNILTGALFCSFIGGWISNMMLLPSGRESICLKSSAISAIINVFLNMFLIPKYGLNSAAFTTFVAELVGLCIVYPHIDKNIKISSFKEMIKGPIIGGMLIGAIGLIAKNVLSSYFAISMITVLISAMVYILVLIITKNTFFMDFVNPLLNKIKRR